MKLLADLRSLYDALYGLACRWHWHTYGPKGAETAPEDCPGCDAYGPECAACHPWERVTDKAVNHPEANGESRWETDGGR